MSTAERAASYRSQKHRRHFSFFRGRTSNPHPTTHHSNTSEKRILEGAASQLTSYRKDPSLTPKKKERKKERERRKKGKGNRIVGCRDWTAHLESCICQGLGVALPLPFCALNSFSPRPRPRPPDLSTAFETQPTNDKHHLHPRPGECARYEGTFNIHTVPDSRGPSLHCDS